MIVFVHLSDVSTSHTASYESGKGGGDEEKEKKTEKKRGRNAAAAPAVMRVRVLAGELACTSDLQVGEQARQGLTGQQAMLAGRSSRDDINKYMLWATNNKQPNNNTSRRPRDEAGPPSKLPSVRGALKPVDHPSYRGPLLL
eukprot:5592545-Pyramimonas_sp.AAC.2